MKTFGLRFYCFWGLTFAAADCGWQFATLKPGECTVYTKWNTDVTTAFFSSCRVGQFPVISGTDELGHTHEESAPESVWKESQEPALGGDTGHVVPENDDVYPGILPH